MPIFASGNGSSKSSTRYGRDYEVATSSRPKLAALSKSFSDLRVRTEGMLDRITGAPETIEDDQDRPWKNAPNRRKGSGSDGSIVSPKAGGGSVGKAFGRVTGGKDNVLLGSQGWDDDETYYGMPKREVVCKSCKMIFAEKAGLNMHLKLFPEHGLTRRQLETLAETDDSNEYFAKRQERVDAQRRARLQQMPAKSGSVGNLLDHAGEAPQDAYNQRQRQHSLPRQASAGNLLEEVDDYEESYNQRSPQHAEGFTRVMPTRSAEPSISSPTPSQNSGSFVASPTSPRPRPRNPPAIPPPRPAIHRKPPPPVPTTRPGDHSRSTSTERSFSSPRKEPPLAILTNDPEFLRQHLSNELETQRQRQTSQGQTSQGSGSYAAAAPHSPPQATYSPQTQSPSSPGQFDVAQDVRMRPMASAWDVPQRSPHVPKTNGTGTAAAAAGRGTAFQNFDGAIFERVPQQPMQAQQQYQTQEPQQPVFAQLPQPQAQPQVQPQVQASPQPQSPPVRQREAQPITPPQRQPRGPLPQVPSTPPLVVRKEQAFTAAPPPPPPPQEPEVAAPARLQTQPLAGASNISIPGAIPGDMSMAYNSSDDEYDPAANDDDFVDAEDNEDEEDHEVERKRTTVPLLSGDDGDYDSQQESRYEEEPQHQAVVNDGPRQSDGIYQTAPPTFALAPPESQVSPGNSQTSIIEPSDETMLWTKFEQVGPASSTSDLSHRGHAPSTEGAHRNGHLVPRNQSEPRRPSQDSFALASIGAALASPQTEEVDDFRQRPQQTRQYSQEPRGSYSGSEPRSSASLDIPQYPTGKKQINRRPAPQVPSPTSPTSRIPRVPVPDVSRAYNITEDEAENPFA